MARMPPNADGGRPMLVCLDGGRSDGDPILLSRAHAEALRRATDTHHRLARHLRVLRDPPKPPLRGV